MATFNSYTAYFDASGDPDDGTGCVFVSGFVSTVEAWLKFEEAWNLMLLKNGITPPFHMTDFATGKPPYEEWDGDLARQKAFYQAAHKVLIDHAIKSFGEGVIVADLARMRDEYELAGAYAETASNAFTYCATGILLQMHEWRETYTSPGDRLEYVHESGDKYLGHFINHARDAFGVDVIPRKKSDFAPFQAADYLAWEHRKALLNVVEGNKRPTRKSLVALTPQIAGGIEWRYSDWPGFQRNCEHVGYAKRRRSQ